MTTNDTGFWFSNDMPWCGNPVENAPWPYPTKRKTFLRKLASVEGKAKVTRYRGFSRCRVCGSMNGTAEYSYNGWRWPSGYSHYIREHGVCVEPGFYDMVLSKKE